MNIRILCILCLLSSLSPLSSFSLLPLTPGPETAMAASAPQAKEPAGNSAARAQGPEWTRWPAPEAAVLAARRTATPPVVDGIPDEAVWREGAWSSAFMDMVDGTSPWLRTEVALLWDDKALYVAVRMEEPWLEANIAERDGPVYRDPDFEIFIAGKDSYWELEVNARNTLYDVFWIWRDALGAPAATVGADAAVNTDAVATATARPFDATRWNAAQRRVMLLSGIGEHRHPRGERAGFIDEDVRGAQVAVSAVGTLNDNSDTDRGWTVEMAIPWEALRDLGADVALPPAPGAVLPMNLSRFVSRDAQGKALPTLRPAAWTLTRHGVFDSHVPERFARVVFTEAGSAGLPTQDELRAVLEAHLAAADRLVLGAGKQALLDRHAAFVARVVAEAPWKDKLTPELVRAWILPLRVTGEPLEDWQEALRAELLPVLAGVGPAAPLTEAALRVRQWLATRAVPGLSPAWSLGPLTLMRAGAGRCEELGILFVNAARSVGIPARIAYAPAWRGADGNHLWVEFWDGAQWLALSPEQPDAAPGTGWFYPQLDKVAVVQTRGFGAPDSGTPGNSVAAEPLLFARDGVFSRDRTAAYTSTGTLRVFSAARTGDAASASGSANAANLPSAPSSSGAPGSSGSSSAPAAPSAAGLVSEPLPPVEARVYVFNGGRPRVVASGHGTDLSFVLGTGSYLLSVQRQGVTTLHSVTVRSGAVTPFSVPLDAAAPPSEAPAGSPVAAPPAPAVAAPAAPAAPAVAQAPVHVDEALGYTPPQRQHAATPPGPAQKPFPAAVPLPRPDAEIMVRAGAAGTLAAGAEISLSDSLYAQPETLRQETAAALAAWRVFWGSRSNSRALTPLFVPHVLSGRVDVEPFSHWRKGAAALVQGASVPGNAEATAQNVRRLLAQRHPETGSTLTTLVPLAALMRPDAEAVPLPDRIWAGLCVAALRSLGIPARVGTSSLAPGMGGGVWVEYGDGKEWRYLLRSGTGYAADEARRYYGIPGAPGKPGAPEKTHTLDMARRGLKPDDAYRTWSLCRVGRGGELFAVPLSFTRKAVLALAAGEYILVRGQRDAQGMAQWTAEPVRVE